VGRRVQTALCGAKLATNSTPLPTPERGQSPFPTVVPPPRLGGGYAWAVFVWLATARASTAIRKTACWRPSTWTPTRRGEKAPAGVAARYVRLSPLLRCHPPSPEKRAFLPPPPLGVGTAAVSGGVVIVAAVLPPLPCPLGGLLPRYNGAAEGGHRLPILLPAEHRFDDGREGEIGSNMLDQDTALLLEGGTFVRYAAPCPSPRHTRGRPPSPRARSCAGTQ
jgi:hypothetical protein